jgi:hypothetical protein
VRQFDAANEIVVPVSSPDGIKKVAVRFPTDDEWIDWRQRKKIKQRDIGRRNFQIEAGQPEKADAELFEKILVNKNGKVDEAEGLHILNRLAACEATERPEQEANSRFRIRLKVLGGIVTEHLLRMPSVREHMDYDRASSAVTFGNFGTQQISIILRPASELYDKLKVETAGYAGEVPVIHKAEAINQLIQEVRQLEREDQDDPEA